MNCHWPRFFQGGTSFFIVTKIIADRETDKQLDFSLGCDFWNRCIGSSNMGLLSWCLNRNRKHPYLMKPLQNQTSIIYLFVSKRKFYMEPLDILIGKHHQVFHVCSRAGYHSPGGSKWGGGDPSLLCRVGYPPRRPFQVLSAACMLTLLSPLVGWSPWQGVWWAMTSWTCIVCWALPCHVVAALCPWGCPAESQAKQGRLMWVRDVSAGAQAGMVKMGWEKTLGLRVTWLLAAWAAHGALSLCPVPWYSTYLLKSSLPATGLQAPPAPASCSHREAWPQHSSVPHYSPGSTSVAISVHSSLWFTVASLSASYSLPKHLGEQQPVSGFGHLAQALESHGKPRDTLWRCNILVLVPIAFL